MEIGADNELFDSVRTWEFQAKQEFELSSTCVLGFYKLQAKRFALLTNKFIAKTGRYITHEIKRREPNNKHL